MQSTAVRQVARACPEKGPNGVVYFKVKKVPDFGTSLADALGFHATPFDLKEGARRKIMGQQNNAGSPDRTAEPEATWAQLEDAIVVSAREFRCELASILLSVLYRLSSASVITRLDVLLSFRLVGFTCRAKHGRPMTLVIDDVQKLAREKPQFMLKLQEFAKDCADGGHLRVVLVSSDLTVLTFLLDKTSNYRCKRPLEVGESDISAAAAVEYLLARLTKEDAEDKWERTDSNKALAREFPAAASYRCCALLALLSMSLMLSACTCSSACCRLHRREHHGHAFRAAEPRGERLQHLGEGSGVGAGAAPED